MSGHLSGRRPERPTIVLPGLPPAWRPAASPRIPLGPTPKLPSSELERHREAHLLPPRAAGGWRDASPKAVRPVVFSGRRSCRGGVVDAAAKYGGCPNEEPFQAIEIRRLTDALLILRRFGRADRDQGRSGTDSDPDPRLRVVLRVEVAEGRPDEKPGTGFFVSAKSPFRSLPLPGANFLNCHFSKVAGNVLLSSAPLSCWL